MNIFCLLVDAPYSVFTTKNKVENILWGGYQEDVKI